MRKRPGPWISEMVPPLQAEIARVALTEVGISEDPPGSNSSPEIDEYLKQAGCPPGLRWCAAFVGYCYQKAGAKIPPVDVVHGRGPASTDEWMRWAKEHNLWTTTPAIGFAVVYGKAATMDAQHIGIVVMVTPQLLTVEGNRALGAASPDGQLVDLGPLVESWKLGFVRPVGV